ncbi:MAG: ABC transporter ATP-binding protein [Thermoanaerobaculaceae bacterium]|jgi:iron complex transport system ATP-binding protein|nr:ABC transporter ATP-binding protein [Thermoanaerobaculaceae bacterium]
MTTLQARRLCGGYGARQVVGPVDLEVEAGSCVGILGPNGAGKSTLLRLLAGILPARAGEVLLLGRSLSSWRRREAARVVGFVPQSLSVAFPLTVVEMVMQGRAPHLGAWQPPGPADEAAVEAALHEVGLGARRDVGVHTMSGGERQLVLLARALAGQPRVLLMDEPATGLDVRHQLALVDTVRRLVATGVGAAVVLHDWNLAARLTDRVLILQEGRTVASGPSGEVLLPEILGAVFGVTVDRLPAPGVPVLVPRGATTHPPTES